MPQGPPVVGIDLSATNLQFGVVDTANEIAGRARGKTEAAGGLEHVLDNVVKGVGEACVAAGVAVEDLGAIGVAAAGAIDMPRGVVIDAPNLQWTDVPLRDLLEAKLQRPIILDNDVNGAAWGEHCLGAGRGRGDMLAVWVGTGLGGGLVLGDRLFHGAQHTAGEIGQSVLFPEAPPGEGILEAWCSRTGMLNRINAEATEPLHGTRAIADAYSAGDARVCAVVDHAADLLGAAIASWVTILSLGTVVLGGGMTEALGDPYLRRIRENFQAHVFPDRLRGCEIRMTELAADSALLGAALLAREAINASPAPR